MRVTKAPGARALAESWMGAAFDPVAAAAHLQSLGLASSASIKGKSIDWTGYRDPDEFSMPPVLTTKTYTDRTCDAFPAALDAIEAMSLGKINIQDYGTPDKVDPAISQGDCGLRTDVNLATNLSATARPGGHCPLFQY